MLVISGLEIAGPEGSSWGSKGGGTRWSVTSPSVKTSPWIELTSEQDPEREQDLDLGIGGGRF